MRSAVTPAEIGPSAQMGLAKATSLVVPRGPARVAALRVLALTAKLAGLVEGGPTDAMAQVVATVAATAELAGQLHVTMGRAEAVAMGVAAHRFRTRVSTASASSFALCSGRVAGAERCEVGVRSGGRSRTLARVVASEAA